MENEKENIVKHISSKCIEGPTQYLGDKQDFDVSGKDPSSGISSESWGKACLLLYK